VPAVAVRSQFSQLWQREMMTNSYAPRTLECRLGDGSFVDAVAFVVRRDAPNYAGRLDEPRILEVFARGSCAATARASTTSSTRSARCVHGIVDPHLERLARRAGIDPATWRVAASA
jgi:cation transport protein ChaC